jgi:hypothetical protein
MADLVLPDPLILHTVQGVPPAVGSDPGLMLASETATSYIIITDAEIGVVVPGGRVTFQAYDFDVSVAGLPAWNIGVVDGAVCMGFFGAEPIPHPSVTGTTTQQQVDSLVAALTALGLVTDNR